MTEKLEPGLEQVEIKQTRTAPNPIRFNNASINKIRASQFNFGNKNFLFIPFNVSKDSHQRGLKLKIFKGKDKKVFFLQYWFNGKPSKYKVGNYSQIFGAEECDNELFKLYKSHTDPHTGYWIKDPNETRKNEDRIVEKPDTTAAKGLTVNEVLGYSSCYPNYQSSRWDH